MSSVTESSESQAISALKRQVATLQEENAQLVNKIVKKPVHSFLREGRAIRRLVSLTELIPDIIAEHDRRELLAMEQGSGVEAQPPTIEQQRTFRAYEKLTLWCPTFSKLLLAPTTLDYDLAVACKDLQAGADCARGDDAARLKIATAQWLNERSPPPEPFIHLREKVGRGFNHTLTGQLLCPVDYDWTDENTHQLIREYHPDFRVTAHSWPLFLYAKGNYDSKLPAKGLFQGELLVRAFQCIFTSPSSSQEEEESTVTQRPFKVAKTPLRPRNNVATLLRMKAVQPRAIAYVAVQIRFALSSCPSWVVVDEDFNYDQFYHNIVEYFELPGSPYKAGEISDLLLWWNQKIFGRRHVSDYRPQQIESLSVARSRT